MRKLSPRMLLIIALTLSIICGMMIYSFLSKNDKSDADKTAVVVAAMDIAPGTQMTAEMLRLELIPNELVQQGAVRKVNDAVGKRLKMPANAGDQITQKRLNAAGTMGSFIGTIPNDKRAVTITVDDVSGVAGFIAPGSYVDVLNVDGDGKDRRVSGSLLLQNVLVLAVGSTDITSDKVKKNENVKTVTLALDPREAVELRVAQSEGRITLMLRPQKPIDKEIVGTTVYGKASQRESSAPSYSAPAPSYSAPGQAAPQQAPASANFGITVIRGTSVSR